MADNRFLIKQEILGDADKMGLKNLDPSPFSPNAFSVLKDKVAEYIYDLVNESVKVSNRFQSDMVSPAHVERASEYIASGTGKRLYKHLGTVGGLLFGAALSNTLAMTIANQYSGLSTLLTLIFGIFGSFLIALNITRD